jgi:ThiF family
VEERNVNRILNSTMNDAKEKRAKVDVLADAAERTGLGTEIIRVKKNLWDPEVIRQVAQCDVIFGCMDSIDGRYLLNAIASYYCIPYFDIGVRLDAIKGPSGKARIREVCGTVNYLRPGRSSLVSRDLFSMADVAAAGLHRNDPKAHDRQVEDGYIKGVAAHRPAVISVNARKISQSQSRNRFGARRAKMQVLAGTSKSIGQVANGCEKATKGDHHTG